MYLFLAAEDLIGVLYSSLNPSIALYTCWILFFILVLAE